MSGYTVDAAHIAVQSDRHLATSLTNQSIRTERRAARRSAARERLVTLVGADDAR